MTRIYSATDNAFHADHPAPKDVSPASSYFRFYLTRALVHGGLGDRHLETLGPWRTMLQNGLTTWAEQPEPTRSDSHAWSAHPDINLLTTVAGIVPTAPMFAQVDIRSALGSLHHLAFRYLSPRGDILAEYDITPAGMSAQIKLPADIRGTLHWKSKKYPLKSGSNQLQIPQKQYHFQDQERGTYAFIRSETRDRG